MLENQHAGGGSEGTRWFVTLLGDIGYGAIEGLLVRGGEPCADPPPRVIRERRFGERRTTPPRERIGTGESKLQVRQCLQALKELGNGVVARLEVTDGLPFKLIMVSGPGSGEEGVAR